MFLTPISFIFFYIFSLFLLTPFIENNSRLSHGKTHGPDKIINRMIKICDIYLYKPLDIIYINVLERVNSHRN